MLPCPLLKYVDNFKKIILLFIVFFLLFPASCAQKPFISLTQNQYPSFSDDMQFRALKSAIVKSNSYLLKIPDDKKYQLGTTFVTAETLRKTNSFFLQLISSSPDMDHFNRVVKKHFRVFQARGTGGFNPRKKMLVTGYYQPVFEGSSEPNDEFRYPLYQLPDDLVIKHTVSGDDQQKSHVIGRLEKGRFLPYWTRAEIENNNLLAGQELVWLKDPMDVFSLHIQGSGLISLQNGHVRGVHYRMKNGREYRSIGKYMVDRNYLLLDEANMETIRTYVTNHPEKQNEIFHHNESFIFFEWTNTMGAIGSLGQELTAGRSVAVDNTLFPPGALAFLRTSVPIVEKSKVAAWKKVNRFVTVQDTGSAIRGAGRVDLFFGRGNDAGLAAGQMKEDGVMYILVKK
jgi:membrane-bound lytic murein transglycosylase A